ncbi:MAG: hypothetical protein ACYS18_12420 [Planctomycetota bacterium]|jgi:hypothetical protein
MEYEEVAVKRTIYFVHVGAQNVILQARNHSEGDWADQSEREHLGVHVYKEVDNGGELLGFLHDLRVHEASIVGMDFHTHGGSGGAIRLGPRWHDQIGWGNMRHFENQDIDHIFRPHAHITFYGCRVAREAGGEYFLARVGEIFLRSGGGTVKGYRVLGGFDEETIHRGSEEIPPSSIWDEPRDDSTLVTAVVRPNGWTAQVRNARWLTPNITRARVDRIRLLAQRTVVSSYQYPYRARLQDDLLFLDRARRQLRGSPSYSTMHSIHSTLDEGLEVRVWRYRADALHRRPGYPANLMRGLRGRYQ